MPHFIMREAGLVADDTPKIHSQEALVLWDYCAERRAQIYNLTAKNLFRLQGNNPHTATFGEG